MLTLGIIVFWLIQVTIEIMKKSYARHFIQFISAFIFVLTPIDSASVAEEGARVPQIFEACVTIARPEDRLACFDAAMIASDSRPARHAPPRQPSETGKTAIGREAVSPVPHGPMTKAEHVAPVGRAGHRTMPTPGNRTVAPRILMEASGGLLLASIDEAFTAEALDATTNIRLNSIFGGRGTSLAASLAFPEILPWGLGIGIDYQFQHIAGDVTADLPNGIQILNDPIRSDIGFRVRSHALSVAVSADSGWQSAHQVHAGVGIGVNWNILEVTTRLSSPAIGNDAVSRDRITDIAPSWHLFGGYRYFLSDHLHLSLSTRVSSVPGDLYGADGRSALLVSVLAGGGFRF
ncbi:MAG: hypothetical protein P1U65_09230 [Minwuia sp.]|nr:hypothetical protein [Minwuia sp.]